jgi:high-affinity iron transporter
MLLDSVILVLREVLEASILVSILLALSNGLHLSTRWLWWSLAAAAAGSWLFAAALEEITDALDGAGQEVANAGLQLGVFCLVLAIVATTARAPSGRAGRALQAVIIACVTATMIREGSEILVYITGFSAAAAQHTAVYAGSAIGAGIGISTGILLFSALRALPAGIARGSALAILGLIGTGMLMQASMLLEQVDWLPSGPALWDSSGLVAEQSIPGQLLYAVFGYEATPSGIQVGLYALGLTLVAGAWLARRRTGDRARAH